MSGLPMPFDQRQRYGVVAALAGELKGERDLRLLDVGGFFRSRDDRPQLPLLTALTGIGGVVVDREAVDARDDAAFDGYLRADAARLPFPDAAFDVVSCLDVIEHIPRTHREAVVAEALRVGRRYCVLAAPVGDDGAADVEARLADFVKVTLRAEQQQLAEHHALGLPTHAELSALLPRNARSFGFGNLDAWFAVMLAKHCLMALPHSDTAFSVLDEEYAAKGFPCDHRPPFYRRYYLVPTRPDVSTEPLDRVAERYGADRVEGAGSPEAASDGARDVLPWIFSVLAGADAGRLAAERAPIEAQVASLTALFREVERSRVYRLYQFFKR